MNKTLEEALRIFVQGQPRTWPQWLGMFEFAYNSSRHSTTGVAPFQLLYGEIPHTPASLIHGSLPRSPDATAFAEGLMSSQLAARDAIQQGQSSVLGAPRPGTAGTRVHAGGGGAAVIRAFVFAR